MPTPVAVVTDSTAYLSPELLAEHEIARVSLSVGTADRFERESEISDLGAWYRHFGETSDVLKTSQPSIGDFLAVYEPLLAGGQDVVSVHISGGISGTVESARQAAADVATAHPGRRIEVVDSATAAGGLAMVVLATACAATGGRGVDEVVARAQEAAREAKIWFAVDTLEYLRRGGRIGTAQAWVGGALKIKPILTMAGTIEPVERVRTSGKAFERLVRFGEQLAQEGRDAWTLTHVQAPEEVARLTERGREVLGSDPVWMSEIGPVIGAHVGPGLLGIGGLPRRLLEP